MGNDSLNRPILEHNQNSLTFQYAAIYLSNPGKVRYRYRMQGTDAEWLGPTRSRYATYAYLPHGNYTFEVEAYTEDQPALQSRATFGFTIEAPLYLRPWFLVLAASMLFGLVYLIVRKRVDQEKEKRVNLKLQYQSRMMTLETQSLNSSMNRHFIFNALNSIQYYINMQDKVSANRYLTSFARLIRKNLDSSEESQSRLTDELERITLYLDLEEMRFQGKFSYKIHVDPEIHLETMRVPAMMLQPFLENSIWHGILPLDRPGTIRIDISKQGNTCVIAIADDGIGYETSLRQKSQRNNGHVSKGMEITQNRMALFGKMTGLNYKVEGPAEIPGEDGLPTGTLVKISLPLQEPLPMSQKNGTANEEF
jgi:two-component sensor histidine kinase